MENVKVVFMGVDIHEDIEFELSTSNNLIYLSIEGKNSAGRTSLDKDTAIRLAEELNRLIKDLD